MKKALALSTICTSLGLAAAAEVPAPGCYARDYDAAHLAANPAQGVAGLRLWVFDEGANRGGLIEARMAAQGQGARDGVAGQSLTQVLICNAVDGGCFVECDGGGFSSTPVDGGIQITTDHFALGEEGCGGYSNLAEVPGQVTTYRLTAAAPEACASLMRQQPLPGAGCYGVDYSDMGRGQGVLGLRLRLGEPDAGFAFAQSTGTLAVMLPEGGRALAAGMGGARVQAPVWCSSRDGQCRTGADEGSFSATPEGDGVILTTASYLLFGLDGASLDLALPDQAQTRHILRRLPDADCWGLE